MRTHSIQIYKMPNRNDAMVCAGSNTDQIKRFFPISKIYAADVCVF